MNVALAVTPPIPHELYREDDVLDCAGVYVFLDPAESPEWVQIAAAVHELDVVSGYRCAACWCRRD